MPLLQENPDWHGTALPSQGAFWGAPDPVVPQEAPETMLPSQKQGSLIVAPTMQTRGEQVTTPSRSCPAQLVRAVEQPEADHVGPKDERRSGRRAGPRPPASRAAARRALRGGRSGFAAAGSSGPAVASPRRSGPRRPAAWWDAARPGA